MSRSGRHAARPPLSARATERYHEFRSGGPFRHKVLAAVAACSILAGSGAVAATQTGLFTSATATSAGALTDSEKAALAVRESAAASRTLDRLALDSQERVTISVTVDGSTANHVVPKVALAAALAAAGIVVGIFDTVDTPLSQEVTDGLQVNIARGNTGTTSDEKVTDFATIEKKDPNLPEGTSKVQTEGRAGITRTTYRLMLNEGEETSRTPLATVVVQKKEDRVVLVGTKDPGSGSPDPGGDGGAPSPMPAGGAREIARNMLGSYGWEGDQFSCLNTLWDRESKWNHLAKNKSSGAYGIPQALPGSKMASAGADWRTNPATQIKWGLGYIKGRYGSPCGALNHFYARGWY